MTCPIDWQTVKRMHRAPFGPRPSYVVGMLCTTSAHVYASRPIATSSYLSFPTLSRGTRAILRPLLVAASARGVHRDASDRSFKRKSEAPMGSRQVSWFAKLNTKPVEFNGLSDRQEEEAKAAILEKVMKGRHPTDLMLRCEYFTCSLAF